MKSHDLVCATNCLLHRYFLEYVITFTFVLQLKHNVKQRCLHKIRMAFIMHANIVACKQQSLRNKENILLYSC